ncbi:lipoprotein insertase outer membrane protein LolB [Candidatus Nitrosacidococcus sp. I8]|uniref:lipoprotein insertase outer membrane protein LolB n=1 Tax=Candidatus Nitrosacidococcus sp. I8 TaxID=2942908 RepID=UPI002226C5C7|nr:lipoprotein insertase outer membrane protein LolB [Candidatus Nitrosacidococcus sp. I8]
MLIILFITGCAGNRPIPEDPQKVWHERQFILQSIKNWDLKGRLSIQAIEERKSGSGTLYWSQKNDIYDISWIFPFGQGKVVLHGDYNLVTLQLPKEEPVTAASSDHLLQSRLGWSLPIDSLNYWVLGLPAPKLSTKKLLLDSWGRLESLHQGNWHIHYQEYKKIKQQDLPEKIFLNSPQLKVRLVIQQWNLG